MAAQRVDPIWGEVLTYFELATDERSTSWLRRPFPADATANQRSLDTISLLEVASLCFLDETGVLRCYRVNVRSNHSIRIRKDAEDRGMICLPRLLRLQVLHLCHERTKHGGTGRLLDKLHEDF